MDARRSRFHNPEYINWLKCSVALLYMKEELTDFVDTQCELYHAKLQSSHGKTASRYFSCFTSTELEKDVYQQWILQWEIRKLFMPYDYGSETCAKDSDSHQIFLSLLKDNPHFITSGNIGEDDLLDEIMEIGNALLHPGSLKVSDTDAIDYLNKIIDILQGIMEQTGSQNLHIQETVYKIQELQANCLDLSLYKEFELKALQQRQIGLEQKRRSLENMIESLKKDQDNHSSKLNATDIEIKDHGDSKKLVVREEDDGKCRNKDGKKSPEFASNKRERQKIKTVWRKIKKMVHKGKKEKPKPSENQSCDISSDMSSDTEDVSNHGAENKEITSVNQLVTSASIEPVHFSTEESAEGQKAPSRIVTCTPIIQYSENCKPNDTDEAEHEALEFYKVHEQCLSEVNMLINQLDDDNDDKQIVCDKTSVCPQQRSSELCMKDGCMQSVDVQSANIIPQDKSVLDTQKTAIQSVYGEYSAQKDSETGTFYLEKTKHCTMNFSSFEDMNSVTLSRTSPVPDLESHIELENLSSESKSTDSLLLKEHNLGNQSKPEPVPLAEETQPKFATHDTGNGKEQVSCSYVISSGYPMGTKSSAIEKNCSLSINSVSSPNETQQFYSQKSPDVSFEELSEQFNERLKSHEEGILSRVVVSGFEQTCAPEHNNVVSVVKEDHVTDGNREPENTYNTTVCTDKIETTSETFSYVSQIVQNNVIGSEEFCPTEDIVSETLNGESKITEYPCIQIQPDKEYEKEKKQGDRIEYQSPAELENNGMPLDQANEAESTNEMANNTENQANYAVQDENAVESAKKLANHVEYHANVAKSVKELANAAELTKKKANDFYHHENDAESARDETNETGLTKEKTNNAESTKELTNETKLAKEQRNDAKSTKELENDAESTKELTNETVLTKKQVNDSESAKELANDAKSTKELANYAESTKELTNEFGLAEEQRDDTKSAKELANNAESTKELENDVESNKELANYANSTKELATDAEATNELIHDAKSAKELENDPESTKELANDAGSSKELENDVESTKELPNDAELTEELANDVESTKEQANDADSTQELANDADSTQELANTAESTNELANGVESSMELVNDAESTQALANDAELIKEIVNDVESAKELANEAGSTEELANDAKSSKEMANDAESTKELTNENESAKELANDAESSKELANDAQSTVELTNKIGFAKKQTDDTQSAKELANDTESTKELENDAESTKELTNEIGLVKEQTDNAKSGKELVNGTEKHVNDAEAAKKTNEAKSAKKLADVAETTKEWAHYPWSTMELVNDAESTTALINETELAKEQTNDAKSTKELANDTEKHANDAEVAKEKTSDAGSAKEFATNTDSTEELADIAIHYAHTTESEKKQLIDVKKLANFTVSAKEHANNVESTKKQANDAESYKTKNYQMTADLIESDEDTDISTRISFESLTNEIDSTENTTVISCRVDMEKETYDKDKSRSILKDTEDLVIICCEDESSTHGITRDRKSRTAMMLGTFGIDKFSSRTENPDSKINGTGWNTLITDGVAGTDVCRENEDKTHEKLKVLFSVLASSEDHSNPLERADNFNDFGLEMAKNTNVVEIIDIDEIDDKGKCENLTLDIEPQKMSSSVCIIPDNESLRGCKTESCTAQDSTEEPKLQQHEVQKTNRNLRNEDIEKDNATIRFITKSGTKNNLCHTREKDFGHTTTVLKADLVKLKHAKSKTALPTGSHVDESLSLCSDIFYGLSCPRVKCRPRSKKRNHYFCKYCHRNRREPNRNCKLHEVKLEDTDRQTDKHDVQPEINGSLECAEVDSGIAVSFFSSTVSTYISLYESVKEELNHKIGKNTKFPSPQIQREFERYENDLKRIAKYIASSWSFFTPNPISLHIAPGLASYFQRAENGSPLSREQSLAYEWIRFQSFDSYTGNGSGIILARNGFYHDNENGPTATRCYACDATYSDWGYFDNPRQHHNPNCPHLHGSNSTNVPIHSEESGGRGHDISDINRSGTGPSPTHVSPSHTDNIAPASQHTSLERNQPGQTGTDSENPRTGAVDAITTSLQSTTVGPQSVESRSLQPTEDRENSQYMSSYVLSFHNESDSSSSTEQKRSASFPDRQSPEAPTNHGEEQYRLPRPIFGPGASSGSSDPQTSNAGSAAGVPASLSQSVPLNVATTTTTAPAPASITSQPSTASDSSTRIQLAASGQPLDGTRRPVQPLAQATEPRRVCETIGHIETHPELIVVANPKHPAQASIDTRTASFTGWPEYLDQTPRRMAEAGFFFTKVADFTRCYACGGGLRNWEAGDDPVTEHTRWYPACPHVNKLKGEKYVEAVKVKQQEHLEERRRQQQTQTQRRAAQPGPPDPLRTSTAAVLAELGYAQTRIRDAILAVRAQHARIEVSAEEVLVWILDDDDRRNAIAAQRTADAGSFRAPSTSQSVEVSSSSSATASSSASSNSVSSTQQQSGETRSKEPESTGSQTSESAAASGSQSGNGDDTSERGGSPQAGRANGKSSRKKRRGRKSGEKAKTPTEGATGGSSSSMSLLADTDSLREENEMLREIQTCKVCMDKPVSVTFLPCGHLVCCENCAPRMRKCPICRKNIRGVVKTFMS